MWNDLFCGCVDNVNNWWQMFNFILLSQQRSFQLNFRIAKTHFASVMTLNNCEIIAETRSWHSRCRRFHSWLVRRFWIICLYGQRPRLKLQRVLWFHSRVIRFNERCTFGIAYSKLTIYPTFFRNQQAVVGNLLKILEELLWPGTSVLLDALQRKQRPWRRTWSTSWYLHSRIGKSWSHSKAAKQKLISFRSWPWWMITKPNKHLTSRKHTYLFYANVNCTCNAEVSDSVRFSNAKWGVDLGYQPCDLRAIVVSTIPDDALLRKLRVLLRTKFWIFSPINKNSVLSRQHSPAINWFNKLVLAR